MCNMKLFIVSYSKLMKSPDTEKRSIVQSGRRFFSVNTICYLSLSPHCVLDLDTPTVRISPNWSWEQVAHIHEMILKTEDGTHQKKVSSSVLFFFWATDYKICLPVDVTSARNLWPFPLTTFLFLFRSSSRSARRQAKKNNTTTTTAAACPATKLCRLSSPLHCCLTQRPGWNDG